MLRAMRSGTILKYVFLLLLAMAAGGLVMMDVQGVFSNGRNIKKTTVAKVDGQKITSIDLDRLVQMAMRNQQITQSEAYRTGLPQRVLGNEINSRIFSTEAHETGILIDDATAAVAIKEQMLAPMAKQGLLEHDALQYTLRILGVSEQQLMQNVKIQLAAENLLKVVSTGAFAPAQMVGDAMKYLHESRRAEYFTLGVAEIGKVPEPTDADIEEEYKATAHRYMLPEYRTLAVLLLDSKALGIDVSLTEEDVQAYYDEHIAEYSTPEAREISQVALPTEEDAKKLREAALASKDLRKAAAEFQSEKKLNVVSGTYSEQEIPEELAAAAFADTKPGDISAPVETPFGWHIVHVVKVVKPGTKKTLEDVRKDVEKQLKAVKSADQIYERANEIDDMLASGGNLADVSKQYNVTPEVLEKITADGTSAATGRKVAPGNIPMLDKVLASGFELLEGGLSPLIETSDGAFMIVSAREVFKAEPKALADVRADVIKTWKAEAKNDLLDKKAAEVMDRINLGESFDKVASAFGKSIERSKMLSRNSPASEAVLGKGMVPALFSLDKIGQTTTVRGENSLSFVRLLDRKIDMPEKAPEDEVKRMQLMLTQSLQSDLLEQYRRGLMEKYNVSINAEAIEEVYAPTENLE